MIEPVQFEKYLVEVGDFKRITNHLRGIYRIYPQMNNAKPEYVNM
jgi:hypothetical protein